MVTAYAGNIKRLLDMLSGYDTTTPAVLELSDAARALILEHERKLEPELRPFGRLGGIVDWASKWIGLVLRNAGRLHLAEYVDRDPLSRPVSERTMHRALLIGNYQIRHALVAFAQMGADTRIEGAQWILRWLAGNGLAEFTRHEVYQDLRGRAMFNRVEKLDPPLALLVEHRYLTPAPLQSRPKTATNPLGSGRRPSPTFIVNSGWDRQMGGPLPGNKSPESPDSLGEEK